VWRALTEPDKIAQWMSGVRAESNWEIGGEITFTGDWSVERCMRSPLGVN
jgi:uncharacterized protein YndB with AHSA1/START domain